MWVGSGCFGNFRATVGAGKQWGQAYRMLSDVARGNLIDPADLPNESILFGRSPGMLAVRGRTAAVASSGLPVLIQGESGTGKEVFAKFLHSRSARSHGPFVKLNCAAVPADVLERELLGCDIEVQGCGLASQLGAVEIADRGTIFLDEIGEMNWGLQAKVLGLLRDGLYAPIGASKERVANARFIFSTSIELKTAVQEGRFRGDLLGRLKGLHISMLPLRDRKEDIPQLSAYLMGRLAKRYDRTPEILSPSVLGLLRDWNWPGNIRELENTIGRILILGSDEVLSEGLRSCTVQAEGEDVAKRRGKIGAVNLFPREARVDRESILSALQANHWSRRKAAEQLNMSYRSFLYRLKNEGLRVRRRSHRGFLPEA